MAKKRRSFTKQFKEEAVKHWLNSEKTADEVVAALGIPDRKYLTRWKKQMEKRGDDAFPGNGKLLGKDAEIARLKKQLKDTEQERDILKKALCIFSKL